MVEVDPERLVVPSLLALLVLGAFVILATDPRTLRPGRTLKRAP